MCHYCLKLSFFVFGPLCFTESRLVTCTSIGCKLKCVPWSLHLHKFSINSIPCVPTRRSLYNFSIYKHLKKCVSDLLLITIVQIFYYVEYTWRFPRSMCWSVPDIRQILESCREKFQHKKTWIMGTSYTKVTTSSSSNNTKDGKEVPCLHSSNWK